MAEAERGGAGDAQADAGEQAEGDAPPGLPDEATTPRSGRRPCPAARPSTARAAAAARARRASAAGRAHKCRASVTDWIETLSLRPSTHRTNSASATTLPSSGSNAEVRIAASDAAGDVAEEPGKAAGEAGQRRGLLGGREVHAHQLEQVFLLLGPLQVVDAFGKNSTSTMPTIRSLCSTGKARNLCVRNSSQTSRMRRRRWDGDDARHHDLADLPLRRAEQQPAGRHDAHQAVLVVHDVEIDDPALRLLHAEVGERLSTVCSALTLQKSNRMYRVTGWSRISGSERPSLPSDR